jgi:predicted transglutaminase-like cysteine proteinase
MTEKKEWHAPTMTVYGDVKQLTLFKKRKLKQPGLGDDFRVVGVSDG